MKGRAHLLSLTAAVLLQANLALGQFNTLGGNHGRTNAVITQGVTIGNVGAVPVPTQAFQVRGDLLGIGNTGEVFRTNAPFGVNSYWRLFSGGLGAANERAQIFSVGNNPHMNINAPNGSMRFYTNTVERMRLYDSRTATINTFPNIKQNGYVGICPQPLFLSGIGPFSRVHLADSVNNLATDYAQQFGFRPWMRNGITMTGNKDQCYMGQKYSGTTAANDSSDVVIQWSDNESDSQWPTDRLRFLFTGGYNAARTKGSRSMEGLESFRVFVPNDSSAYVGIGDWYGATVDNGMVMVDPSERLDVLDRTIRIRRLIPDYNNDTISRVVVVDTTGRLHWRRIGTWPSTGNGCDWTVQNPTTSGAATPHYLYTAVGTNDLCPDKNDLVGIGAIPTTAKLQVYSNMTTDATPATGVSVQLISTTTAAANGISVSVAPPGGALGLDEVGVNATATNGSSRTQGLKGTAIVNSSSVAATSATGTSGEATVTAGTVNSAYALYGEAVSSAGTVANNHGLWAKAVRGTKAYGSLSYATLATTNYGAYGAGYNGTTNYGLYGEAFGGTTNIGVYGTVPDTTTNTWAGYFNGKVQIVGNLWHNLAFIFSDENLKTDIHEVTGSEAGALLAQLAPKSYQYAASQYPHMNFPVTMQYGFLAQEVQEVLPELVGTTHVLEVTDSTGAVLAPAMDVSGVNYVGMIPLLVAGYQAANERAEALEQQLAQQDARLAHMEEVLAACCASPTGSDRMRIEDNGALSGEERLLKIQPNPFSEATTLYYTLERSGRMQLLANSADGKQLRVLSEASQEAGQYQYEWNTTDLGAGVYYVTLLLDGEPIVKKAVKVQR